MYFVSCHSFLYDGGISISYKELSCVINESECNLYNVRSLIHSDIVRWNMDKNRKTYIILAESYVLLYMATKHCCRDKYRREILHGFHTVVSAATFLPRDSEFRALKCVSFVAPW